MFSEINRICEAYTYVPVLTEIQGLTMIAVGTASLGASGILKVEEYYTGRKQGIPYISDDAARFNAEVGVSALKEGFKRIAPVTGVVLAVYVLSAKLLFE